MYPEIKRAFQKRFGLPIRENYGITEAGGLCTDGFPHQGVKISIRDTGGKELGKIGQEKLLSATWKWPVT